MTKNPPDFLDIAQKAIDKSSSDDARVIKARIIPVLLSSYDESSLTEIKSIQQTLKEEGYINTVLIDDVPTDTDFKGKYDTKFLRLLRLSEEDDFFIIPIFYFSPPEREPGIGHHSELVDLITFFTGLVFITGIFYHEKALRLNQIRVIPSQNHFQIHTLEDFKMKATEFVSSYFPFVERNQLLYDRKPKNFYTLITSGLKKGDKK